MTQEAKAKRYDEAVKVAENIHRFSSDPAEIKRMEQIFPELKESKDERIRKAIIEFFELQDDNTTYSFIPKKDILTWLEKQGENANFFNKIQIGDKVTRNRDGVLVNLSQLNRVAKPAERQQKPAFEMITPEESLGIDSDTYNKIVDECIYGEQKTADKVEPKFKVKYAGSEYNVFETKDINGVTFYGIEDEPNHIDYVKAENCEIISGYGIKENGSLYPTKPAKFSEQKPAWSEEDDDDAWLNDIISKAECNLQLNKGEIDFLKSIKNRYTWKPSEEQIKELEFFIPYVTKCSVVLQKSKDTLLSLLSDLKKLREE